MRTPFSSLCILSLRSSFGLTSPSRDAKPTPRQKLKRIGFIALAILVTVDVAAVFVLYTLNLFDALAAAGLQELILLQAASAGSAMLFALTFILALSTWSLSPAEEYLLCLPLKPAALLGAKIFVAWVSGLAFSLLFVGTTMVVYALRLQPGPMFFISGLLTIATLPLVPIAAAYLLLLPLMSGARLLKDRNTIFVIAGLFGMALALGMNLAFQSVMLRIGDPVWLRANLAGPGSILDRIATVWLPARLAWKALSQAASGEVGASAASTLANLGLGLTAVGVVAWLFGPVYARSLPGFSEKNLTRNATGRQYFIATFRVRPPAVALFVREWRLMNREPAWLLNGPFIVLLLPLIVAFMLFAQRDILGDLAAQATDALPADRLFLIPAAFGAFLGTSTSICPTALSRDAKALSWLRSLPVQPHQYMAAKLLHGLAFAAIGVASGTLATGLFLKLSLLDCLLGALTGLAFASLIDLAGLWLDTAFPKLAWDNPVAAVKQNPNAVFVILGSMAAMGLCAALATLPLGRLWMALLITGTSGTLFCVLWLLYLRSLDRRFARLEV